MQEWRSNRAKGLMGKLRDDSQRETYKDYIENEIPKEQEGCVSKYDVNYNN